MMPVIRLAEERDFEAITTIYNDVVLTTTAIYEDKLRSIEQTKNWYESRLANNSPVFVSELDGQVIGWATYGPFRSTTCSRSTAEHGLHLTPKIRGKGYGKQLLKYLIDDARAKHYHALVGAIDAGNTTSLRLHETFGFKQVGLIPQMARKFDRWLDLVFVQLILD